MPQIRGNQIPLTLYDESSYGADPSPSAGDGKVCYFTSDQVNYSRGLLRSEIIRNNRGAQKPVLGNVDLNSSSLSTTLAVGSVGWWLKHLHGTPDSSGVAAPYTHVFTPKALPVGFTVEKDLTDAIASTVHRANGMRISQAQFTIAQEGVQAVQFSLAGKRYQADATSVLDAAPTDPGHVEFQGHELICRVGGTQASGIIGGSVTVDNGIEGGPYTLPDSGDTAGLRYDNTEDECLVSGNLNIVFEDHSLLTAAAAGTPQTIEFEWTKGLGDGSASGNEKLTLKITDALLEPRGVPIESRGGIQLDFSFQAYAAGSDLGIEWTYLTALDAASL